MKSSLTLLSLFESELEPSRAVYNEIAKAVIKDPRQISSLVQDNTKEETLLHLITHSHRLARLFHRVHDIQEPPSNREHSSRTVPPRPPNRDYIASEIVTLFLELLPTFSGILEDAQVIELLVSALENCLLSQPPSLWKLASVLADYGNILERLASDDSSEEILYRWVSLPITLTQDAATLKVWTQRLVDLVDLCTGKHGIHNEIQRWKTLVGLKRALHSVQESMERKQQSRAQNLAQDMPVSSTPMIALDPDDKKSHIASGQKRPEAHIITLDENLHGPIREFGLQVPSSRSELEQAICTLEGEATISILRGIARTYPCKLCKEALSPAVSGTNLEVTITNDKSLPAVPPLENDIFGKPIGVWKVLLSGQAFKSLQGLSHSGHIGPIREKMLSLASGEWKLHLAGSEKQRNLLRVPLAYTKCGLHTFILWQVDVGIVDETGVPHQVIKVWEVGDSAEISKSIDRVAVLQRTYTHDLVRQCKQQPISPDGKRLPTRFKDPIQDNAMSAHLSTDLDVRIVDQDVIDMANKFYALTEPMIRSILADDLNAEFPLDVSQDEIHVIRHFETSSLILGRSGTGKTTCLVFKLVGKHLARRRLMDERCIRQVLLTRSSFLADKLRAYVRRLIESLTSESLNLETLQEDDSLGSSFGGPLTTASALNLSDDSFPLVCTFEGFLELLENTVRAIDRKDFHSSKPHAGSQVQGAKLATKRPKGQFVDFQAFRLDYWPRLPHVITRSISVDLVFAEIMGVIKGSLSSRESLKPLSREEYLRRSSRLAPNFQSEAERSRVYEAFQAYEGLKVASEGVDHVDRVVKLLRAIRGDQLLQQLLASTFDEVYIDEVQDQRPLDFELLLSFVKDSRGFHFAGDTAQAISQDSTFRFADIKALFHDHFAATGAAANQRHIAQTTMFMLDKNYRSHQGILALASCVMAMLWKGFPDMVDKLKPETGRLLGPQPVLFVGCDANNTLISSNVGKVKLSERSADFGAEQVILVRDAEAKTILQDQIGNVALVLTILQAKGMEFDDVILWDFFSGSPNLGGIRSLNALVMDESDAFDARKNSGICSELKHLYVAITRARIQLFLIESDETAVASVVKLLTQDVPQSLVEVIRPNDANFAASVENLRPGTSNDPRRWLLKGEQLMQQGNYKDALLCFEKAHDRRGETIAKAKILEEDGRVCFAQENTEGFRHNLEAAIGLFLEIGLVGDASRNLVRMGDVERAAELWLQNSKYGKAAQLFEESGRHEKAADCYHSDENYIEAAAVLRKGNKFDSLVSYLSLNREHIPLHVYHTYSRLCKVLLKQEKISYEHRKHAVDVLGSSAEQESYFIEYEMYDDLANFYVKQQRHGDHFYLLVKLYRLEEALYVWFEQQLSECAARIPEDEILNVLDYVCAGKRIIGSTEPVPVKLFQESDNILLPNIARRVQQWIAISRINTQGSTILQNVELRSLELKTFFSVQSILNTTVIHQASELDSLPFELIEEAINFSKDIILRDDSEAKRTVFLITGVLLTKDPEKPFVLLPWSPLSETITDASAVDLAQMATQWVLNRLASAVLLLDSKSWDLFKQKYPRRCLQYLSKGFCQRKRRGEDCSQLHERVSTVDCSRNIEDLRRVTAIFCDLTILHNRRIFMDEFQRQFLPIRRSWLERFLRQLTFVSSVEQDASVISMIQAEELREEKVSAIGPCLELLLYHRLGKEWEQRSDFSSLLEQMQLAKTFGKSVHARFFRALSFKLFKISLREVMQEHLKLLNWLEDGYEVVDALVFRRQLDRFLTNFELLNTLELSSMHAVTAVMEKLALILILKISPPTSLVPQSWIELYIPQMRQSISSVKPLAWEDKHQYQECLLQLMQSFARLLGRLDIALKQDFYFSWGGKPYSSSLLQQRNAECLAVGLVNLPPIHPGISRARDHANEVFCSSSVRAEHLKYKDLDELAQNLAYSLATYEGKNSLVIVSEDSRQLSKYQKGAGVTTRSMNDVLALMKHHTFLEYTAGKISTGTLTDEKYTQAETEAVSRIQKFWRSRIPKLKQHRDYMQSPKAKVIQLFIALSSRRPVPVTFKALLVSRGVAAHLRFPKLRETIAEQHQIIMSCLMNTEIPDQLNETLDDALKLISQLNQTLKAAMDRVSEERLGVLLSEGGLRDIMDLVEGEIGEIEQGIEGARKMIDKVSAYHS